jgi:hypothetical protein
METAYTSSLLPAGSFFDGVENHTTLVYTGVLEVSSTLIKIICKIFKKIN